MAIVGNSSSVPCFLPRAEKWDRHSSFSLCTKDGQRFIRERGFPLEAMEGRAVHRG